MKRTITLAILIAAAMIVAACSTHGSRDSQVTKDAYFVRNVKPVLERNCLRCHDGVKLPHEINLSSGETALKARKKGRSYIVPGKPDSSLLVTAISRNGIHPFLMPRLTLSLTDDEIGALREWIEDGAVWPAGQAGRLKAKRNPENP